MLMTEKWKNKRVCCMGDSLTQAGVWTERLSQNLGCRVYRHCKGGLKMREIVDGGVGAEGVLPPLSASVLAGMDLAIFLWDIMTGEIRTQHLPCNIALIPFTTAWRRPAIWPAGF